MNKRQRAQALSEWIDDLLQGQETASATAIDPEIEALGKLGRSLADIPFTPRPAHRAGFERLLQEHRPALQAGSTSHTPTTATHGGTHMSGMIFGIPFRWILGILFMIVSLITSPEAPTPELPEDLSIEITTGVPVSTTVPIEIDMAAPVVTPTLTVTVTVTPTATLVPTNTVNVTLTETITPSLVVTPTATVTPTLVITATPTVTATPTLTPTEPLTETELAGLAFHPTHLNAGGKCRLAYSASGSLKNHGTVPVADVQIAYEIVSGDEWVDRVEISPSEWSAIGVGKPGRFTVYVYPNEEWASAGKGTQIQVRLYVVNGEEIAEPKFAEATFTVKNQCTPEKTKPDKPEKQDPVVKPEKTKKPKKDK